MEFEASYWGLFIGSFLAATIIPFSSEAILSAVILTGHNPVSALIIATSGNWLGGITSYSLGFMGKQEWVHRYLKIPEDKLDRVIAFTKGKELWVSTLCWVPFIGDIIAVALGFLKANFLRTAIGMLIGKATRYIVWAYISIEIKDYFF